MTPSAMEVVLSRTVEEAAFVFLEPCDDPAPVRERLIEATLRYACVRSGELRLAIPETFASALAANLLGEEEGGAEVTGDDEDAVGELLNMVAGRFALEVFGRAARCSLGVPAVRRITPGENAAALASADTAVTLVDEEGRRVDLSCCAVGGRP